tara:strand:- start:47 stop:541 length:495 start_codon:yes stop_codon:yes gene_type:complete
MNRNITNILSTRCPGKRLTNEINREWTDTFQDNKNTYYHRTENNIMTFFMFFKNLKNPVEIHMRFNNLAYPFKPPEILIGPSKYRYISLLPSSFSFSNRVWGDKCPCCDTIVCKGNWGPQNKLSYITDEIRINFNKKIRLIEIFYCKKIVDKIFGHYLPIEEFL